MKKLIQAFRKQSYILTRNLNGRKEEQKDISLKEFTMNKTEQTWIRNSMKD